MPTPLSSTLRGQITELSETDPLWRQFIYDHRLYLLRTSRTVNVDATKAHVYRFAPIRYLTLEAGCPMAICWIVLYLNNIQDPTSFTGAMTLKIPDFDVLTGLSENYTNSQHTQASALASVAGNLGG